MSVPADAIVLVIPFWFKEITFPGGYILLKIKIKESYNNVFQAKNVFLNVFHNYNH